MNFRAAEAQAANAELTDGALIEKDFSAEYSKDGEETAPAEREL